MVFRLYIQEWEMSCGQGTDCLVLLGFSHLGTVKTHHVVVWKRTYDFSEGAEDLQGSLAVVL